MRLWLKRVGFALAVAAVAVLCLSSAYLAAAVGALTAAIVAIDMLVFARPAHQPLPTPTTEPTPDKISVDLTRRQ
jgi:hypothetical protein